MQRKFISRRSFLKCAGVGAVAAAGLLAGCGGSDSSSSTAASTLLRLRRSLPIPISPMPA